jgi:Tfp pilus assembly protein PilP
MMTFLIAFVALAQPFGQAPLPTAAIGAARAARTQVEAAQQKNAEALQSPAEAQPPQGQQPPPAATPTTGTPGATAPAPAKTDGPYSYDPAGRRDPFVSLVNRGEAIRPTGGVRPPGLPGLLIGEISVKGIFQSKSGLVAIVQGADNKTYIAHPGDRVFDGSIKSIAQDAIVFAQDVNDPLSTVKQREVRKTIRPEAR